MLFKHDLYCVFENAHVLNQPYLFTLPFGGKMLQESFIIGVYISALEQIWTSVKQIYEHRLNDHVRG